MIINRVYARANRWTFAIPPVRALLSRYVTEFGRGWADPYSGTSRWCEHTNDLDVQHDTTHHLDAAEFAAQLPHGLRGVLYDPPYSYRQVSEHYRAAGRKASRLDTSYNYYRRVQVLLAPRIASGGYAISFGWNSNGFGTGLGFSKVEILLVAHGLHHNDTICVVERKE